MDMSIRRSFIFMIIVFGLSDTAACIAISFVLVNYMPMELYNSVTPYMAVALTFLCLIIVTSFFYKKKIEKPFLLLMEAVLHIQNHELEFALDYHTNDEMGKICGAFEEMRKALYENNKQMWQKIEEKEYISGAFSHDMRTPLTVINGYLEIMEDEAKEITREEFLKYFLLIKKQVARIEQYVESINELHTLEDLKISPQWIEKDTIEAELKEISGIMSKQHQKEIKFHSDLYSQGFYCDGEVMLRVAENLMLNSVRYAGRSILLSVFENDSKLIIKVQDDGPGFSGQAIQKAKEPFFTESGRKEKHFGIGLYICDLLCSAHGGGISLKNGTKGAVITAEIKKYQHTL